jgi:hypothetical protein
MSPLPSDPCNPCFLRASRLRGELLIFRSRAILAMSKSFLAVRPGAVLIYPITKLPIYQINQHFTF